jgi:hypothetical protein
MNSDFLKRRLEETRQKQLQSSNKSLSMPSIGQMARNLGKSVANNAISVVKGNDLRLTPDEANRRLNICKGCQFFDSLSQRCSRCGCFLSVKTYLKAESCPVGKW